ncbi:hypothetical protein CW731_14660 [Polaribacter sp. ALD11]|uniref:hypothetical protein n=1 Tax=Polaribacter sp. ALD11 TaxID=2058137 RepID=UPI000C309419|nr:hypothetical protein [Polaribacter sp. ALD11]AUC86444.1 hypothetical protein CW731_14660 [Polaribacter sp. ALD11]
MISYVKRQDLDIEKYDDCIEKSVQSRIYAFSWYLDIVADNWDVLVLEDYEAVMPIPWRKKYGIKYVSQPHFCQQLGVFSKGIITEELQKKMLKKIPKKFVKITLNLNSYSFFLSKMLERKNYILLIKESYEENYKDFNKNRKRVLRKIKDSSMYIDNVEFNTLLEIAKKDYNHLIYKDSDYKKLNKLISISQNSDTGFMKGVYNENDQVVGGVFFLKSRSRLIYLFSVMTTEGKKLNAATFLISHVLKKYQNKNYILDFEGSMNKGIANFFRSFGAKEEVYKELKTNAIQRIIF